MAAPNTPQDIIDRLRRMEREIRELKGRANIRPAMNTISGGDVVISNGGGLAVHDPDGTEVFRVGHWEGAEWPSAEYGVTIRRQTGEVAISTTTGNFGDDNMQEVQIYDREGNVILGDKSETGWGLARPYLPIPMQRPEAAEITSSSWTTAFRGSWEVQNPKLMASFNLTAYTGEIEGRVMADETQVGPVFYVANASQSFRKYFTPEQHGALYSTEVTVRLEARRLSGTDPVHVYNYGFSGTAD